MNFDGGSTGIKVDGACGSCGDSIPEGDSVTCKVCGLEVCDDCGRMPLGSDDRDDVERVCLSCREGEAIYREQNSLYERSLGL